MPEEVKKNCNSCKLYLFKPCETLQNNEEFQSLRDDLFSAEKFNFKENFICANYKSRYIEYPIEVSGINYEDNQRGFRDKEIGKFVKIRPCAEEHRGKTFLGIYLGDLPTSPRVSHHPDTKILTVGLSSNPAIFVFELKKIVFGYESWWGFVESEDDLRQITQDDIDNTWYVKALKELPVK